VGTDQPVHTTPPRRRRLLLHGESVIASVGIALAAILLSVMATLAWWTMRTERTVLENARVEQIHAIGFLLSHSAETILGTTEITPSELSALRRLVADAGAKYDLTQCRIVLSDGTVIASADPTQITAAALPESWTRSRLLDDGLMVPTAGVCSVSFRMTITGRGDADLEITAPINPTRTSGWEAQTGVGVIGAVAMLCLLFVYRHMRSRVRALGAIREALLAIEGGETAASILQVSTDLGIEAKAWNEVIAAREKLRKQDVAERAKEALGQRGEARGDLLAACDAMSQGLLLVDENNVVTYANGAAAVFMRARKEDLLGQLVNRFLLVDNVLQAIRDVAGGSVRRRTVMDVERKDDVPGGAGVLRFSVRPVRRDDAASAMVTIEDITQQKVAEEARHAFVAHTTHELRTPLTNIRLYVETAIDEGEQNPATRAKCLNVINGETRRLERIVGEMLSMAEIEAGSFKIKPDDVRLEALFDELKADYQQQAIEKHIALDLKLPPKLPVIRGDRDKIMLALHNLVGNALKYTPDGGKVTIGVEVDGRHLSVTIADTGIGIGADDVERIFERFYRAKDPRVAKITGTGLGLTLAREVVRMHGGDITVESQLNQGSTFTMTLPVKAEAA
jgi:PAS domain S-box-containing protein